MKAPELLDESVPVIVPFGRVPEPGAPAGETGVDMTLIVKTTPEKLTFEALEPVETRLPKLMKLKLFATTFAAEPELYVSVRPPIVTKPEPCVQAEAVPHRRVEPVVLYVTVPAIAAEPITSDKRSVFIVFKESPMGLSTPVLVPNLL